MIALLPAVPAAALENRLAGHPSPYLALHGADPVAWQDWGPAVMAQARRENRLVYLSIGYFSCHWCHVMQRESYQNAEIAEYINTHFIPVKIDRELDPALDARMMEFVEATRGMGGWPLNVFVTPDGHPLFATLYHPPAEFLGIVRRVQERWREDSAGLAALARSAAPPQPRGPGRPELDTARVDRYREALTTAALARADGVHGGFGEQSKFPMVPQLDFLLDELARRDRPDLRGFLLLTLDHMAGEGLQDHLGGGFFRYTVDPTWRTPHFEKMLYDNVLLGRLYLRAGRQFGRDDYTRVGERTFDFVLDVLRGDGGAYIASLSALDDRDVEGGYYLWSADELARRLGKRDAEIYRLAWGMQDAPPFDAGWLPVRGLAPDLIAKRLALPEAEVVARLSRAEATLRKARAVRGLPRDSKQLAAWNGLALGCLAEAARLTRSPRYRAAAGQLRDYLVRELWDGAELRRAVAGGRALGRVALEDYAFVAWGLAEWAELSGVRADAELAARVARSAWRRFHGKRGWRLIETPLIAAEPGQDVISDGPLAAPSATLAAASLKLAARLQDPGLRRQALAALNSGDALIDGDPFWYAATVAAMRAARE